MKIEPYKIKMAMNLKNIIDESREVSRAIYEFADKLEQIEKKYANIESQESEDEK